MKDMHDKAGEVIAKLLAVIRQEKAAPLPELPGRLAG
jgi:hypothetical protein